MNKSSVRNLRKPLTLIFGVGLSLLAVNAAFAQQTPAADTGDTVKLEKFVVTGSNIPLAAAALAVPVAVIDSKVIENSGVSADTLDILRKVAPNISGVGQENAQIATGSNFGGASVNIKGLPTLVIINGRRVANDPAESTGGFQFVDIKHCHGYLGHELLSAVDRPGRYGGSFENRTRFLREIVAGIRAAAPGLAIGVRVSAVDWVPYSARPGDGVGVPDLPDDGSAVEESACGSAPLPPMV